eukprot:4456546-Prymnesium_polylepis.1
MRPISSTQHASFPRHPCSLANDATRRQLLATSLCVAASCAPVRTGASAAGAQSTALTAVAD